MTKEEYQQGIQTLLADLRDPNGEFSGLEQDFSSLAVEISEHDPVIGGMLRNIGSAMGALIDYVKQEN